MAPEGDKGWDMCGIVTNKPQTWGGKLWKLHRRYYGYFAQEDEASEGGKINRRLSHSERANGGEKRKGVGGLTKRAVKKEKSTSSPERQYQPEIGDSPNTTQITTNQHPPDPANSPKQPQEARITEKKPNKKTTHQPQEQERKESIYTLNVIPPPTPIKKGHFRFHFMWKRWTSTGAIVETSAKSNKV